MASKALSIVVPTYAGKDQIINCLKSVLDQDKYSANYEVIVVSDGSEGAFTQAKTMARYFEKKNIVFKPILLKRNIGRFETRITGAETAKYNQLLFVDERVRLEKGFLKYLEKTDENAIMPNVVELETSNPISMTLNMLRRRVYGAKWGSGHTDYYLDTGNFENSPKGTTSLYIKKTAFLKACAKVKEGIKQSDSDHISDDTKVLSQVINNGDRIFRPGGLKVYYLPRGGFYEACSHLFWRGPKFVDYYHKPGTRFFPLLVAIYVTAAALLAAMIISPAWLLYCLLAGAALVAGASAFISRSIKQFFVALIGLPLTVITFSAGVLTGTFLKVIRR